MSAGTYELDIYSKKMSSVAEKCFPIIHISLSHCSVLAKHVLRLQLTAHTSCRQRACEDMSRFCRSLQPDVGILVILHILRDQVVIRVAKVMRQGSKVQASKVTHSLL